MGSFGVDIDFRFNQAAIQKGLNDLKTRYAAAMKDVEAGTEGAGKKVEKIWNDMAKMVISTSTRSGRAVENSIRAVERQAEMAGKVYSEQILIRQKKHIDAVGKDEEAVKRLTSAYQKLYQVQLENERKAAAGPSTGGLLLRGARDIFEGRMSYGVMDLGRAAYGAMGGGATGAAGAAGLSSAAIAIGGLTAAFVGLEVAGYAAAKAIGAYGREVHDMQIKTGLSAVEVQQLQYAAKLTGTDIGSLDRVMRSLTADIEDVSSKGDQARNVLRGMGVDLRALREGRIPTMQLFEQISDALEKQPNLWLRNKEAIDVFGRAGIPVLPMFTEIVRAIKDAQTIKFPGQETIDGMRETNAEIVKMETELDNVKLRLETLAAKTFTITYEVVRKGLDLSDMRLREGSQAPPPPPGITPGGQILSPDVAASIQKGLEAKRTADQAPYLAGQQYAQQLARGGLGLEAAEQELSAKKQIYDQNLKLAAQQLVTLDTLKQSEQEYRKIKDHVEALRQSESDRRNIEEALRRATEEAAQRRQDPFALPSELELEKQLKQRGLTAQDRQQFQKIYAPQIQFERREQADKLDRQMLEMQQSIEREKFRATLGGVQPVDIRELGKGGVTSADVQSDINEQYKQRLDIARQIAGAEEKLITERKIDAKDTVALAQQERDLIANNGKEEVAQIEAAIAKKKEEYDLAKKEREEARQHTETMSKIQLADQEEGIKHDADLARKRADLRFKGDNPAESIAAEYRIATEEAAQLYQLEMQRIALHETGYKAEEDAAIALHKLHREDEAAREDAEYKIAKMQQEQLDNLKSKIEPLYHTLFTDPKNFGKQLRSTVTEAALHPIVSGLSEMTAKVLYPAIYGSTGTGGLAGIFSGGHKFNDITLLSDKSLPVTIVNDRSGGTSIYCTGGYSSGGGTYLPGFGGIPGITMPWGGFGPGGTAGFAPGALGLNPGLASMARAAGGTYIGGGGGIPGFTLPDLGPGGTAPFAPGPSGVGGKQSPWGGIFKSLGGMFGGSPTGKNWGAIKGNASDWGSSGGDDSTLSESIKSLSTGPFAGTPIGGLAGGLGIGLASTGIFGQQRGQAAGVVEAAAGGFLAAGPIGAAVGGLIGLGEMAAGVESPRHEAIRLAKSIYHIGINNTTADQIVATANQSYGGNIATTMRSPQVRQMLGLYAAGTGQGSVFQMGVDTPHGASLVESGGSLYQQATYQYGLPYTQRSSLPVYGGVSSDVIGPPGAPGLGIPSTYALSLNIGGQDAAKFMTGQVVSPDVIQTQYAAAMNSSSGRVPQALMMSEPGSIAS